MITNETDGCAVFPVKAREREIGFAASLLAAGSEIIVNYEGKNDVVCINGIDSDQVLLNAKDYKDASRIAEELKKQYPIKDNRFFGPLRAMTMYRQAMSKVSDDPRKGKKGIIGLKDKSGSGYWRMVLPSRYMDMEGYYLDLTSGTIPFDYLAEYDIIFNQRTHDWHSYYTLEKLKQYGKHIVYDIDDDLWNITPDNPAFRVIGKDQQEAAVACMKLAHVVTASTDILARRVESMGIKNVQVIPNALDVDDKGWLDTSLTGSPDGLKRIFWQGSPTHGEDWMECIQAVDIIMSVRDDVRLCLFGFLPLAVQNKLNEPHWRGRVEFMEFSDTETYFNLIKYVRAECGLAPLRDSVFNGAKSEIKWLEYSLIGIPTVASDVFPYKTVIKDKENGRLVTTTDDWVNAIQFYLDRDAKRRDAVSKSRDLARERFDIKKVAKEWEKILKFP